MDATGNGVASGVPISIETLVSAGFEAVGEVLIPSGDVSPC